MTTDSNETKDPLLFLAEQVAAAESRLCVDGYGQVASDPLKRAEQILHSARLRANYDRAQAALAHALRLNQK
jgi:hypothetical protein